MNAGPDPRTPAPLLSAANAAITTPVSRAVGFVPSAPKPGTRFRAVTPAGVPFTGAMPLKDIALPGVTGALGIPEIVLAAYRNAELALAASEPHCGISWNLLAGIGRIESGHANNGKTDVAGTTVTRILGPVLDGTLAGNAVIRDTDGGASDGDAVHDRAMGPMQFIPGTWRAYASDGNADGVADPNNVFDAALSAGKYLCSGGLDLRDPAQELRAVLRYNNSMSYAANVLSWSAAYRTGGSPAPVNISANIVPPGTSPIDFNALALQADTTTSAATTSSESDSATSTTRREMVITVPGMAPVPCGVFCPEDYVPQEGDWRQYAEQTTTLPGDQAVEAQQGAPETPPPVETTQAPPPPPPPNPFAPPPPPPPVVDPALAPPVEPTPSASHEVTPTEQPAPAPLIPGLPFTLPVFPLP